MTKRYPQSEYVHHNGFYTQAEREHIIVHHDTNTGYMFISTRDIVSDTVFVVHPDNDQARLASAIAGFIASFMIWEYKRFNGFSGFGNIKWAFIPKTALKHVLASDMLEGFTNADLYKRLKQGVN